MERIQTTQRQGDGGGPLVPARWQSWAHNQPLLTLLKTYDFFNYVYMNASVCGFVHVNAKRGCQIPLGLELKVN